MILALYIYFLVNGQELDSGFDPMEYIVEQGLNNENPGKSAGISSLFVII